MKVKEAAATLAVALALGSSGTAVALASQRASEACTNQQALVDGLYTILDRSTERLPQLVDEGTITQTQADQAYRDNRAAKRDIKRPQC